MHECTASVLILFLSRLFTSKLSDGLSAAHEHASAKFASYASVATND